LRLRTDLHFSSDSGRKQTENVNANRQKFTLQMYV